MSVYPHPQLLTPSALHSLRHLTNLKSLELEHTNVGDFELSIVLGALTSLTRVRFGGSFWTGGAGRWCVVLTGRLGDIKSILSLPQDTHPLACAI